MGNTGNTWTWVSRSNTLNQPGVYGTRGTADSANMSGARHRSAGWTGTGVLWLFAGLGYDSNGDVGYLNDLWKFDGSTLANQPGNYGIVGVADSANVPAGRRGSISWQDCTGNLWLFGGLQFDPNFNYDPNVDPPPPPPGMKAT